MDDWVEANDEELVMTMLKQDEPMDDSDYILWMIVTRVTPTQSIAIQILRSNLVETVTVRKQ